MTPKKVKKLTKEGVCVCVCMCVSHLVMSNSL